MVLPAHILSWQFQIDTSVDLEVYQDMVFIGTWTFIFPTGWGFNLSQAI